MREETDHTYLLVAWGEKPTGGYKVEIEEIARGNEREVAVVSLTPPEPRSAVTEAITYPFDLVATAQPLQRPVVFAYRGDHTITSPLPLYGDGKTPVAESDNFRVFSPAPDETIESPVRLVGQARVFEGAFTIEIEDGHNLLARRNVYTAGAPEWGDFDETLAFDQPTSPAGAIIFVTYSARDGSRQEELILPVKFNVGQ